MREQAPRARPPRVAASSATTESEDDARFREWAAGAALTSREMEVVQLAVRGLRNHEIGQTLGCAPTTVRNHLVSIFRKLDVTTRSELAFAALHSR